MAISNRIVDKFVKATKNDKNIKKEKTVYGNIVDYKDGIYYAQIDGATNDNLIPISRLTSNVQTGEKVIIMIKDHTAIVTGNVSKPSIDGDQAGTIIDEKISQIDIESIDIDYVKSLWV